MADASRLPAAAPQPTATTEAQACSIRSSKQGRFGAEPAARERGKNLVKEFVAQVLEGSMTVAQRRRDDDQRAHRADRSPALDPVERNPASPVVPEAGRHLARPEVPDGPERNRRRMLKIKVLNVSKKELLRDLQRAPEFDQSALFKKVYEEEYGVFGGAPFGALIGDYEFGKHPEDIELLERISHVAAAAHAPFLSARRSGHVQPGRASRSLDAPRDLAKIFDTTEYAKWKSFRQSEDSRYVGLCLPRVLAACPTARTPSRSTSSTTKKHVDGTDHSKYLWMNAAYSLGTRLTNSFAHVRHGARRCAAWKAADWSKACRSHNFYTDEGDVAMKCPTEVPITDRREKELADLGFVPLVHCKGTDYAAFFSVQICAEAEALRQGCGQRQCAPVHAAAVHHGGVALRALSEGDDARQDRQLHVARTKPSVFLNRWITQLCTPDDTASPATKAQRPLREARIDVTEVPGKPGVYRAVAFLRPHFQLDELTVSLRLVAELPGAGQVVFAEFVALTRVSAKRHISVNQL